MRYTSLVHPGHFRFRNLLVAVALMALAVLLTVPWTFWVIRAAYDRDIVQNAVMLARRVEGQVPIFQFQQRLLVPKSAAQAMNREFLSDDAVQMVVFYDLSNTPRVPSISFARKSDIKPPTWDESEFRRRARDVVREEDPANYKVSVPWIKNGRTVGITYVELSREALREDFWVKEGPLLKRVMGLTAAAVVLLTVLSMIAWSMWSNSVRVQQRATMQQQGLLAERGLTAAVLAHEIRNPLAALRFQLHSLKRGAGDAERVGAAASTIEEELIRIQRLVDDYLKHEKAVTLHLQSVDLQEEARKLQTLMGELLQSSGARLLVTAPATPVRVACDPHALRQVLMNLVLNAQQAMGKGGTITLHIARDESSGIIQVTDTGPGIPPEIKDRLFKPFQTTKPEGTGIGLALVKRFADNFGGTVSVESEPGRGASFRLALPLAPEDKTEPATPIPSLVEASSP
jgi:signal transduction histidine kinase